MNSSSPSLRGMAIDMPMYVAAGWVQTKQVSLGPERVDLAALHRRRRARAERIRDRVGAVVLVFPQQLAVGGVEAQDALIALDALALVDGEDVDRVIGAFAELPI